MRLVVGGPRGQPDVNPLRDADTDAKPVGEPFGLGIADANPERLADLPSHHAAAGLADANPDPDPDSDPVAKPDPDANPDGLLFELGGRESGHRLR